MISGKNISVSEKGVVLSIPSVCKEEVLAHNRTVDVFHYQHEVLGISALLTSPDELGFRGIDKTDTKDTVNIIFCMRDRKGQRPHPFVKYLVSHRDYLSVVFRWRVMECGPVPYISVEVDKGVEAKLIKSAYNEYNPALDRLAQRSTPDVKYIWDLLGYHYLANIDDTVIEDFQEYLKWFADMHIQGLAMERVHTCCAGENACLQPLHKYICSLACKLDENAEYAMGLLDMFMSNTAFDILASVAVPSPIMD